MHTVIRKYTAAPAVVEEVRPKLALLEATMRKTPGFVAYSFIQTDDGVVTITTTEDKSGAQESVARAANWVKEHLPNSALGTPEVTTGETLITASR